MCLQTGIFLNGRREKIEKEKLTLPGVQKVFNSHRYDEAYEPGKCRLPYLLKPLLTSNDLTLLSSALLDR